jgi:RraA family protein
MNSFSKPGYTLNTVTTRLVSDTLQRAAAIPTPNLSDSMGKIQPACPTLKPMHTIRDAMVGRAVTVRVPPGDNLLVYKAIVAAEPGDVLVVDAGGVLEQAIVGEIMTTLAASRGLAGMVIYGAIRDIDIVGASGFPVYACGYTYRGPYRDGPGEMNVPIALSAMVVNPGDLVVGDANGVMVVPFADIERVLSAAEQIKAREIDIVNRISTDRYDTSWIDSTLRERGYSL